MHLLKYKQILHFILVLDDSTSYKVCLSIRYTISIILCPQVILSLTLL